MPDASSPDQVDTTSPDLVAEQIDRLKSLFPEVVTEGKVDFEKLKATLGEHVDDRPERFDFTWAGKQDAIKLLQSESGATLKPDREASINFDTTDHVFIEGENLETLKLLYKAYFGRVKMIYIDPPYNTGKDFIYPDNFHEPLEHYLRVTGQKDTEGNLKTSEIEKRGRFHSAWLSMMYPRLFLARQILKDDGVIFVSIDDNEVSNLRHLMNEVFGEENFITQLVWEKGRKNDAKLFSVGHEYMLVYARSKATLKENDTVWREPKPGAEIIQDKYLKLREEHGDDEDAIEEDLRDWYSNLKKTHPAKRYSRYNNVDERGVWRDDNMSWPGGGGPEYDVIHPETGEPCAVPPGGWRYSTKAKMLEMISKGRVVFRNDHTEPPIRKTYLIRSGEGDGDSQESDDVSLQVMGSYFYKSALTASNNLLDLFGKKLFDNPKDHEVIARMIKYVTGPDDIIVDFFAGSATTAQSVLETNLEEDSNRRFILVQYPEPTPEKSSARKAGYDDIAELGKELIRRVIEREETPSEREKGNEMGFRAFKLASSNFNQWDGVPSDADPEEYIHQLDAFEDRMKDDAEVEDVIYEVALKEGYSLTINCEEVEDMQAATVWKVTDTDKGQAFYICLDDDLSLDALKPLELRENDLFICRDTALNDTTAANLALQCRFKVI